MGMYDDVRFFSDWPECPVGHKPDGFQTNETREDVRKALTEQGLRVLPDDDRVVQKRLEQWRAGKR